MRIYLAGNTPDRIKEEKQFKQAGLFPNRLITYI